MVAHDLTKKLIQSINTYAEALIVRQHLRIEFNLTYFIVANHYYFAYLREIPNPQRVHNSK